MPTTVGLLLLTHAAAAAASDDHPTRSASAKSSPFPAGVTSSGWIPFEFYRGSRIFLPAEINGVQTHIMLDSGASQTVLDARFVERLKVKGSGQFTGQGAGGAAAYTELHGVNITLGAATFRDTDSVGIDLSAVEKQVGHDLPVVLGGDAFALCVVDIDFVGHRIAFLNPSAFDPPSGAKSLAVTKAGENFAVQASIEGRAVSLVFDIGNASALNLYPEVWNRPDFLGHRLVSTTENGGLGGMHVYQLATIKSVDLAGSRFTEVPTVLRGEQKGVAADGNIGLPILRRFRILVDLPHNRVLFAAPVDTKTSFGINHTGLTLAPDPAGAKVLYVAPGSPAAAAALKTGDVIVTIDGVTIEAWEAQAGLPSWIYGVPGQQIRIGLLGEGARTLAFGKYF